MKVLSLLFLVLLGTLSYASDVVVLTDDNFEHLTQASTGSTTGDWFIEIYAPWCGHCKNLIPIYEDFATQMKGITNVGKIDGTENRDLAKRFKVGSYPTLFFMKNGYYYAYTGGRTVEDFKAFIETGFKTAVKTKVPQPPTEWDKILEQVEVTMSDFEHIMKFRKSAIAVVLIFGFLFGIIFTLLAMCCCGGSSKPTKPKRE